MSSKISKSLAILQKLIKTINISNLQNLYYSFIYPYLINGITVWGSAGATALNPVIKLQKRLVRILSSSPRYEHTAPLLKKLKFLPLEYLFKYAMLIFMFKYTNNMLPQIYQECFTTNKRYKSKETRQSSLYYIPRFRTNYLERNILVQGPTLANQYKEVQMYSQNNAALEPLNCVLQIYFYQKSLKQICPPPHTQNITLCCNLLSSPIFPH